MTRDDATVGAGMIGAGVGSLAGGYISEEKLGGSYELGAFVGNLVGGVAGSAAFRGATKFKAMRTLNDFRAGVNPREVATTVAAYDTMSGKVAVASNGDIPGNIAGSLTKRADRINGIGSFGVTEKLDGVRNNVVGRCAEFRAANQLLSKGSYVNSIRFTPALRPNRPVIVTNCENCREMFPQALKWITKAF